MASGLKIKYFVSLIIFKSLWNCHCATDTLKQGETLNSTSGALISASGNFTLTFIQYDNSFLAITRVKNNPNKAWIANRDNPIPFSSSPFLTLDATNTLKITQQGGDPFLLATAPQTRDPSTSVVATLLDSGNFVLQEVSSINGSSIRIFWQSFDYPVDTFLPGMKLGVNHSNGHTWSLLSWAAKEDPKSTGDFSVEWNTNTHQLEIKKNRIVYWTSGVFANGRFEFILPTVSNRRYNFSIVSNQNEDYLTYTSLHDPEDPEPELVLYTTGSFNDHGVPVDIARAQDCDGVNTVNGCVKRELTREHRRDVSRLVVTWTSITAALLIMLSCIWCYVLRRRKVFPFAGNNRANIHKELQNFKKMKGTTYRLNGIQTDQTNMWSPDLIIFSFASVLSATENFSAENKLGKGGFGPVYKGKLETGREIAVKRLSKCSGQGTLEFKNELVLISELQHTNLVQLYGCCIHGEERMLIYEYMPNKSLDYFLFDSTRTVLLDWKTRFSIIEGITQGLLYLHKYSRTRIIHRDLKASNILLDESMNPKISDFGMARIFKQNEQVANTDRIMGTYGYMSPEYAMEGTFSIKSDVYSFGVLMLEIISGRKNSSFCSEDRMLNIVGYTWELWKQGAVLELLDPALRDSCIKDQLLRCIHVGLLCVEEHAADRPTMLDVASMLTFEGNLSLPVPTRPAFCAGRNVITTGASGNGSPLGSINGLSNSGLDGR